MGMIRIPIERKEPIMRWIPCSERLPEHDNHVLCCTATAKGKKNIIIGYYLHGSERWASGMNSNVIAWMELPDPYREAPFGGFPMPTAKKLPSGTWRVRVYVGKKEGKTITQSFTGPTKKDAERKASTFLAVTKHNDLTFGEAAEKYIEAKANVLSPNTIRTYKLHASRLSSLDTNSSNMLVSIFLDSNN